MTPPPQPEGTPGLASLPADAIQRILGFIAHVHDLNCANAASRLFRGAPGGRSPVEHALRERSRMRGHDRALPAELPAGVRTWTEELFARERMLELAPADIVAAGRALGCTMSAFVDAEGGLHTCGEEEEEEDDITRPATRACAALGHPHAGAVLEPMRVASLSDVRIRAVAAGWGHLLALSDAGAVYACGENAFGQLGLGDGETRRTFTVIDALRDEVIVGLAAGVCNGLALSAAGAAYSWGYNENGQLGLGDTEDRLQPRRIEALGGVRLGSASLSRQHTLLLATSGDVYSCGHGLSGQLGLGSTHDQHEPRRVEALRGVRAVHVSAGHRHSLVVDDDGVVHSFGGGRGWQGGDGTDDSGSTVPTRIAALEGVRAVRASVGLELCAVLGAGGSVHVLGGVEPGVLDLGHVRAMAGLAQCVPAPAHARVVSCSVGYRHALFVTADACVHSCGSQLAALGLAVRWHPYASADFWPGDVPDPMRIEMPGLMVPPSPGPHHSEADDAAV